MGAGSWVAEPPWAECLSSRSGPGSPCRLRSRSIMMCRCRALAMALESLGRSRSAGMMLLVTPGQWAPDSVTDCQNSGGACREVGAQRDCDPPGRKPFRRPLATSIRVPGTSVPPRSQPQRRRACGGLRLCAPAPPSYPWRQPPYSPCRRLLRGLRRALAPTSYPAIRINPSGVTTAKGSAGWTKGKAEALRDGCRDVQIPCGFTGRPGR